jgi:hypothetical protein
MIATVEAVVAGHEGIQFADTGEWSGLYLLDLFRSFRPQQVVDGGCDLVAGVIHVMDTSRTLDDLRAGEFADHLARILNGVGEVGGFEDKTGELLADAAADGNRQFGYREGRLQKLVAHGQPHLTGFLGFFRQSLVLGLHKVHRLHGCLVAMKLGFEGVALLFLDFVIHEKTS